MVRQHYGKLISPHVVDGGGAVGVLALYPCQVAGCCRSQLFDIRHEEVHGSHLWEQLVDQLHEFYYVLKRDKKRIMMFAFPKVATSSRELIIDCERLVSDADGGSICAERNISTEWSRTNSRYLGIVDALQVGKYKGYQYVDSWWLLQYREIPTQVFGRQLIAESAEQFRSASQYLRRDSHCDGAECSHQCVGCVHRVLEIKRRQPVGNDNFMNIF